MGSTSILQRTVLGGALSPLRSGGGWLLLTEPSHQAATRSWPGTARDLALGACGGQTKRTRQQACEVVWKGWGKSKVLPLPHPRRWQPGTSCL